MSIRSGSPGCASCPKSIDGWRGMLTIKVSPTSNEVMDVRIFCESCYKSGAQNGSLVNWKDYASLHDVKDNPDSFADKFNEDLESGNPKWTARTRRMIEKLIGLAR